MRRALAVLAIVAVLVAGCGASGGPGPDGFRDRFCSTTKDIGAMTEHFRTLAERISVVDMPRARDAAESMSVIVDRIRGSLDGLPEWADAGEVVAGFKSWAATMRQGLNEMLAGLGLSDQVAISAGLDTLGRANTLLDASLAKVPAFRESTGFDCDPV